MNIRFNSGKIPINHILSGSTPWNLVKILADNNFKVSRRFLPRLLNCFAISILSYPNVLLERLLFNKKIRQTIIEKPLFILGYPRSGTTNLVYLLSRDKRFAFSKTYECIAPHVIFTFGKVMRSIARKTLPKTRPMDNMPLGATLPKEEEFAVANMTVASMVNALYFPEKFSKYINRFVLFGENEKDKHRWKRNHHYFLQKISLKNNYKPLLLKSPFNTGRVKEILEAYPDAKFIHIYRHPFDVYSSNIKLYEGVLPQTAFQTVENQEMESHILYSYEATYQKYFREKALIPANNLVEIAYEQFVGNEFDTLRHIYHQLQLGDFKDVADEYQNFLSRQKNYKTNPYSLTPDVEEKVFDHWKFAFEKFGYSRTRIHNVSAQTKK